MIKFLTKLFTFKWLIRIIAGILVIVTLFSFCTVIIQSIKETKAYKVAQDVIQEVDDSISEEDKERLRDSVKEGLIKGKDRVISTIENLAGSDAEGEVTGN